MFRKQVKCCKCGFLALRGVLPSNWGKPTSWEELKTLNELGLLSYTECTQQGREHIANGTHTDPAILACTRHVWSSSDFKGKEKQEILATLNARRKCLYFFQYNPSYSPDEHKELQREAKTQRLLIIGTLLGALIGALAAIVAQLISD